MLEAQRQDYDRALRSHDQLSTRLDKAVREGAHSRSEAQALRAELKKTLQRAETKAQMARDLTRQVQELLAQQEGIDSDGTTPPPVEFEDAASSIGGAANLFKTHITETVVTYKNVKEVVALNQKLLLIVRSERSQHTQQLDESKEAEKATAQRQMEQIAAELGNMKERREQQQRMMEEIVRQRDMYRELHNENARRATHEQRSGGGGGGGAAPASAVPAQSQSPQRGRSAQASAVAAAESALLAKANVRRCLFLPSSFVLCSLFFSSFLCFNSFLTLCRPTSRRTAWSASRRTSSRSRSRARSGTRSSTRSGAWRRCVYSSFVLFVAIILFAHYLFFFLTAPGEGRGGAALRDAARRAPRGGELAP